MFSWRTRRQLAGIATIAALIGGIWVLVVPGFLPNPSCSDGRRNQREIGVDCGGPCVPCEVKNPKPIIVLWSRAIAVEEGVYDVAAQVRNPNEVLSSPGLHYEFTLRDDLGEIVQQVGRTFVFPQEDMHITDVVRLASSEQRKPTAVEFSITDAVWQLRHEARPNIVAERREYREEGSGPAGRSVVEASIVNRTLQDFVEVEARFLVFDADDNLLGANRVVLDNLLAGERAVVLSRWPRVFPQKPSAIIIEVRANAFDANNILRPF